jgi:hypothetical protein
MGTGIYRIRSAGYVQIAVLPLYHFTTRCKANKMTKPDGWACVSRKVNVQNYLLDEHVQKNVQNLKKIDNRDDY